MSRAFEPGHDTGSKMCVSNLIDELGGAWEIKGMRDQLRVSKEVTRGDRGSIGA